MFVFEGDAVGDPGAGGGITDTDVDDCGDFPEFEDNSHALTEKYHPTWSS